MLKVSNKHEEKVGMMLQSIAHDLVAGGIRLKSYSLLNIALVEVVIGTDTIRWKSYCKLDQWF